MDDRQFDELTRRLVRPVSRRQALKLAIAALAGSIFADSRSGRAFAGGGNSDCAHFCHAVFSGDDAGKCTSDAAHGTGLCYSACGPNGAGGTLCGAQSNGQFKSYSGTACCTSGSACCGNTCTSLKTTSNCG